ncbi:hypothetical protein KGM_201221 [Danaus plexippus plexippus]|uniref:Uncharacterized protein n=1 Tax=Danaus plexippus plexippus TaxID=278856 RepID=A0A212EYY8_DANPL|nr:hypothetical protein KGM_201221 [Danaus plexippus plexippus]
MAILEAGLKTNDISSEPVILYDVLDYSKPESSSYFQHNEPMLTFDYLAAVSEALHLMYRRRLRGIVDHRLIYCNHFFLALRMGWISICPECDESRQSKSVEGL